MTSVPVGFTPRRRRQLDDLKDDRLVRASFLTGEIRSGSGADDLEDLSELVGARVSTGAVEVAQILMCAKCVGECKVF